MRGEAGAAFEEIGAIADTLPHDDNAGRAGSGAQDAQNRYGVGGYRSRDPLLEVIEPVVIGIGVDGGAIGRETVLLKPGVERVEAQRLKLVGPDVNRGHDARVAVEVRGRLGEGVV